MIFYINPKNCILLTLFISLSGSVCGQVVPVLPITDKEFRALLPNHLKHENDGILGVPINDSTTLCIQLAEDKIIHQGYRVNDMLEGVQFEFSKQGELLKIETFKKDCLHGKTVEWYDDGSIKCSGDFYCLNFDTLLIDSTFMHDAETGDDILVLSATKGISVKHRNWFIYNSSGLLIKKQVWSFGDLLHEEEY